MEKYFTGKSCIVMSREEARAFDAWAIGKIGIPGAVLMENAGRSCGEFIIDKFRSIGDSCVCVFCGKGNNGGDGYVIARHLLNEGFTVKVALLADIGDIKGDARINLDVLLKLGITPYEMALQIGQIAEKVKDFISDAPLIVDCIFGTGLAGQLSSEYIELIESINADGIEILAVDIPSGLDCDSGKPLGAAIKADNTITFGAVKKGFANDQAKRYTGQIYVAGIGVSPSMMNKR